jgi:tetratricopeptide (TPR) repeat protein
MTNDEFTGSFVIPDCHSSLINMKMRPLLTATLIAWSGGAFACINISDITLDGKKVEQSEDILFAGRASLTRPYDVKTWREREGSLRLAMMTKPTLRQRADYGGVLAHLGDFKKARTVLEDAEKLEPGDYAVASNLGTVCELLGDNEKARTWIAEGVKRQPTSHQGTEWLHLKILDAKLALAKDPQWLQTHRVLGIDYGDAARPVAPAAPEEKGYGRLNALSYQLRERLNFVKAPEPIAGELLFALGDELCLKGAVETALGVYELAATYQPAQAELLKTRTEYAQGVLRKAGVKPKPATKTK